MMIVESGKSRESHCSVVRLRFLVLLVYRNDRREIIIVLNGKKLNRVSRY